MATQVPFCCSVQFNPGGGSTPTYKTFFAFLFLFLVEMEGHDTVLGNKVVIENLRLVLHRP